VEVLSSMAVSTAVSDVLLAAGIVVVGPVVGPVVGMLVTGGGTWQPVMPSAVMAGIRRTNRMTGQTPGLKTMPGTLDQPVAQGQTTFTSRRIFRDMRLPLPRPQLFSKPSSAVSRFSP
jgi:hypothetical protein